MHHRLRNYFGRTRCYFLVKRLKWKLGSVCPEIVLILMQDRCTVSLEHTICSEINLDKPMDCRCIRWNYKMKCIIWNLASVQLEIVLVSVQDSCMVCAQCTIGSEIVVEVPDGTPW